MYWNYDEWYVDSLEESFEALERDYVDLSHVRDVLEEEIETLRQKLKEKDKRIDDLLINLNGGVA